MKELMNEEKIDAVGAYKMRPLFTDAEKSALDYATEPTKNKKVRQEIFSRLRTYYSERQVCEIGFLVASEHLVNLTNCSIHSDYP
jgi:alkylhydroperoxidase family enzyme